MAVVQTLQPPAILGLLSEPVRWQIVAELGRSDRRVGELVQRLGKPQNLVSYHLAELRRLGLVHARRSSADGRDVYYRADLPRVRGLLAEAGRSLHPGTSLGPRPVEPAEPVSAARAQVLFLCTGNSARSQMAQALVEHRSAGAVEARSAGSHPKALHPNAVRVMAERGVDIAGRATRSFDEYVRTPFDRVITLCDKVREVCPDFAGDPVAAHWSIADPAASAPDEEGSYAAFCAVADELEDRVAVLLADLTSPPMEGTHHA